MSMYYIRSTFLSHQKQKKTKLLTGIQFSSIVFFFFFFVFWCFGFLVFWYFIFFGVLVFGYILVFHIIFYLVWQYPKMISELDIAKMLESTAIYSAFMLRVVLGGGGGDHIHIYIYIYLFIYLCYIHIIVRWFSECSRRWFF